MQCIPTKAGENQNSLSYIYPNDGLWIEFYLANHVQVFDTPPGQNIFTQTSSKQKPLENGT